MPTSKPLPIKTFVSHCVDDKAFVFEVCDLLAPYLERAKMFCFEEHPSVTGDPRDRMMKEASKADLALIFVGARYDKWMCAEAGALIANAKCPKVMIAIDGTSSYGALQKHVLEIWGNKAEFIPDAFTTLSGREQPSAFVCAKEIHRVLMSSNESAGSRLKGLPQWNDEHMRYGLPARANVFSYEKDIIEFYVASLLHDRERMDVQEPPGNWVEQSRKESMNAIKQKWPAEKVLEKTTNERFAPQWPSVTRLKHRVPNPLLEAISVDGGARNGKDGSEVSAAALLGLVAPGGPLTFPEAGPRSELAWPDKAPNNGTLNVAVLVGGGIAPGINAVIDSIVQRHYAYAYAKQYKVNVWGVKNGLLAFNSDRALSTDEGNLMELTPVITGPHATLGGSMLGTARDDELLDDNKHLRSVRLKTIAQRLREKNINILYVIGGDGSMHAAHAIWYQVNLLEDRRRMSVVGVPKTMDNDILWMWQSFGFLSAVEEARCFVERMHTEVRCNPRLGIVQFFGSDSGYVVSHAVLATATGHAMLALIPEVKFSIVGVANYIKDRLRSRDSLPPDVAPVDPRMPHGLIVLAETAIPVDARECLGIKEAPKDLPMLRGYYEELACCFKLPEGCSSVYPNRKDASSCREPTYVTKGELKAINDYFDSRQHVHGQTSDDLRNVGVKILRTTLAYILRNQVMAVPDNGPARGEEPDWSRLRTVTIEPRYLVRALEPSTLDIINGQRLGLHAVDAGMAGYTDCMVSQWLTEFVYVPLELVVLGRKRIPPKGMFWQSVREKTGQPDNLVTPYIQPSP